MRLLLPSLLLLSACRDPVAADTATPLRQGDPDAGWQALLYGDYVGSGVPKDVYFELLGKSRDNVLERDGDSADVNYAFNLFEVPNGTEVIGGITCLGCHGGWMNRELVVGLGDTSFDWTTADGQGTAYALAEARVITEYGEDSPEAEAIAPFTRGGEALDGYISLPFRGVNPAFALEQAAAAWRDPTTMAWQDQPLYDVPQTAPATDVPPWWNVKKKQHLYYTGLGQGQEHRLVSQISVVALTDLEQLEGIADSMIDVLAWIDQLEPPAFPGQVDATLVGQGQALFLETCAECHGTYGDDWTYPELRIPVEEVGTDPLYAEAFVDAPFTVWARESWFGEGAEIEPSEITAAYVPPPLDGIWATAPYLHNGSVPDLWTLLDSAARPTFWTRHWSSSSYDHDLPGWTWWAVDEADEDFGTTDVYDTTVAGYDNGGHTYGDSLNTDQRAAVIEYLKTL